MSSAVTWPWLTVVGIAVAAFVALVQERKLSFDLFARRFDAYDDVNKAISARLSEIAKSDILDPAENSDTELREFWRSRRPMRFLFSKKIDDQLTAMERSMVDVAVRTAAMRSLRPVTPEKHSDFTKAYDAFLAADSATRNLQDELLKMVTPYMKQATAFEWLKHKLEGLKARTAEAPK